ncbi:GntR family transcriptional regulator [Photobacterium makurazakiensis]|uniref:GntR family transcriptional regulator n=1 Tax=Photobacterium TaxID=657 RepID=UPI003D0B433A
MNTKRKAIWREIYETLLNEIKRDIYPPNTALPSENILAERFGVTRMTVRKSLNLLQQQGVIYSIHGKGVFVKQRLSQYRIRGDQRFATGLEASDMEVESETLSLTIIPATFNIADELRIKEFEPVWQLVRLRYVNGLPTLLNRKYFPTHIFPEFDRIYAEDKSVTSVYKHYGFEHYQRLETRVRVGFLNEEDAKWLEQSSATPALLTTSLNVAEDGTLIEFSDGCWPHNSIELVF